MFVLNFWGKSAVDLQAFSLKECRNFDPDPSKIVEFCISPLFPLHFLPLSIFLPHPLYPLSFLPSLLFPLSLFPLKMHLTAILEGPSSCILSGEKACRLIALLTKKCNTDMPIAQRACGLKTFRVLWSGIERESHWCTHQRGTRTDGLDGKTCESRCGSPMELSSETLQKCHWPAAPLTNHSATLQLVDDTLEQDGCGNVLSAQAYVFT